MGFKKTFVSIVLAAILAGSTISLASADSQILKSITSATLVTKKALPKPKYERVTSNVYVVDGFYLAIPKMMKTAKINVIIDDEINEESLNAYFNSEDIALIRLYEPGYFSDLDDINSMHKLKAIIDIDILRAKKFLDEYGIKYSGETDLTTKYNVFREWFMKNAYFNEVFDHILNSPADPNSAYKTTPDELGTIEKLEALKEIVMEEAIKSSGTNNNEISGSTSQGEKAKVKVLSTGKSLLSDSPSQSTLMEILNKSHGDGFTNVVLLSIISMVVTVGTIAIMLSILK